MYRGQRFPAFNGNNYPVWKTHLYILLQEQKALQVIEQEPPNEINQEWIDAEHKAKSALSEHVAEHLMKFVKVNKSARECMLELEELYNSKSMARQLMYRMHINDLKYEPPLTDYLAKMEDLVTKLVESGADISECEQIAILLKHLPKEYKSIKTTLKALSDDKLNMAFVQKKLLEEEIEIISEMRNEPKVLTVQNKSIKPNWSKRKPNHRFNNRKLKCFYCGKVGHIKANCFLFKNKRKNYNRPGQHSEEPTATIATVQSCSCTNPTEPTFCFMMSSDESDNGNSGMISSDESDNENSGMITFLLDSGATNHMTNRGDLTSNFSVLEEPIKMGIAKKDEYIIATKTGTLRVITDTGMHGELNGVLYCPEVPHNILSVGKLQQSGMQIVFDSEGAKIFSQGNMICVGVLSNGVPFISFQIDFESMNYMCCLVENNGYELWHKRLGHIGDDKFQKLKADNMIEDSDLISGLLPNYKICEDCIKGKQTRLPFNRSKNKEHVDRPLFIIHSDVCGPISPQALKYKNYFLTFIDEYSHYCVVYLLTHKSEVFPCFKDFVAKCEAQFNSKIVYLYCDNGREYLSNEMREFCSSHGISYHLTVPRTPQLNGVAERLNRTIIEKARCILLCACLNKVFWGDAVLTAGYLINVIPTKAIKCKKTPFELWHGKKPQIKHLRVFGSTAYVHNKVIKNKFDEKSVKCILVGYEPNGYRVWNCYKRKHEIVRDVIFDEIDFKISRPSSGINGNDSDDSGGELDFGSARTSEFANLKTSDGDTSDNPDTGASRQGCDEFNSQGKNIEDSNYGSENLPEIPGNHDVNADDSVGAQLRRSQRIKGMTMKDVPEVLLLAHSLKCSIPNSYSEVNVSEDKERWLEAINEEIESLCLNNTWTLVPRPENKNIVDCKWVFTIKNDEYGNPMKYKARLVARGFSQRYLEDYNETFAPVARIPSLRFILAFANQNNLLIHHMDVKTAFLNGTLKEEIYMNIPEGVQGGNDKVCRLNKSLYGLKQAARCWFEEFEKALKEIGFKNSEVDRCIYFLDRNNVKENIYVVLYVDDLVIATADKRGLNKFKTYLMQKFKMVDLNEIKLFLGMRIIRNNNMLTIDQTEYIKSLLDKFEMSDCNPVSTPFESKVDYSKLNDDVYYESPCRQAIGCLMYLMICTRPDLSISVNLLSRYMTKNNLELWRCIKRIFRYLKGTINLRLTYNRTEYNDIITGFVDSDWGGDLIDRKSTTGFLFKLYDNCTITWNTRRQATVATSSTEAEYMALYEAVKEAMWLKSLSFSIDMKLPGPIILWEDNMGCINIANNPSSHKRSKHIDIKYHFSRERVETKDICVSYIPTDEQVADIMTKPLDRVKFLRLRLNMGLNEFNRPV